MAGYRAADPVILICQDNAAQRIDIREMNAAAEEILGFRLHEAAGRQLADFLPARIQELMQEYVEYEDDGNDVGTVLGRVQHFCLINKNGQEVPLRLKVLRAEAKDRNARFQLILHGKTADKRKDAFYAALRENLKGHEVLDAAIGVPNRASLAKDVELVTHYVNKGAMSAALAVLAVDDLARYADGDAVLRHVAQIARQSLRPDDTIGRASQAALGIILLDTTLESSRMVLNRLRWLVASKPLEGASGRPLTISIAFTMLSPDMGRAAGLLEGVEAYLNAHSQRGNAMLEMAIV